MTTGSFECMVKLVPANFVMQPHFITRTSCMAVLTTSCLVFAKPCCQPNFG
eukprot:CAMPEP_0203939580 /NCGR_PEP_ID=MMETSP0359-20131031/76346_1 /ASSEMBLY_ACC=CAM_ASM_000338 /TAXON_ID=268821 /ORGANISM="Scrippsiella Hangoei, Strain SHTV-5" /LENGTH=50 /DNA_ID=CAMNT_0050869911 /DNA_START=58 /DNA_END=207 /DNA_ORIENTATION=+